LALSNVAEVPTIVKDIISWAHLERTGWKPTFVGNILEWTKTEGTGKVGKLKCEKQQDGMYYLAVRRLDPNGLKVLAVEDERPNEQWCDITTAVVRYNHRSR
jgi:hypothetical protein